MTEKYNCEINFDKKILYLNFFLNLKRITVINFFIF